MNTEPYAGWQQKRGMLADAVDWAIHEYDEFMKDDAYDSQRILDKIVSRLREVRSFAHVGNARVSSPSVERMWGFDYLSIYKEARRRCVNDATGGGIDEHVARVAYERGAVSSPVSGTGWEDISTAPKDGTTIDVWINGEFPGRRADVCWREPTDSEWWAHGGDTIETPEATWHDCFGPLGQCEQPTHWQHKPAPPAPLTQETNDVR